MAATERMLHIMTRWFALESADAEFFDSAPHVFRFEKHYAATAEQVWESQIGRAHV